MCILRFQSESPGYGSSCELTSGSGTSDWRVAMIWLDVLKMGRANFLLLLPYGFQFSDVPFSGRKHSLIFIGSDDGFRCAFLPLIGVAFHKAILLLGISSSLLMVSPLIS